MIKPNKLKMQTISIIVLFIFAIIYFRNPIFGATTTGYHLEYHDTPHTYSYDGGRYDSTGTYRETYYFYCNNEVMCIYQWSWYVKDGSSWGESAILDKDGVAQKAIKENSFENFKASFLPNDLICEGYEVANTYFIHYDENGGSGSDMPNSIHTYDQPKNLTANTYSKTGYTFDGWNTKANGTGIHHPNKSTVVNLTESNNVTITLYAQWSANTYTINFDTNGGTSNPSPLSVTYNSTYGTLPEPVRTGYTFKGWYTSLNDSKKITASSTVTTAKNHTLYAHWDAIEYNITYDANGGKTSATSATYHYKDAVDLTPTAKKTGYTFIGWATSPQSYMALSSYQMPAKNITLYALYTIDVSDIANHNYPDYNKEKEKEVYLLIKRDSDKQEKIYPLTYQNIVSTMTYQYLLDNKNISSFVTDTEYSYYVIAHDNADNHSVLVEGRSDSVTPPDPIIEKRYLQTTKHYRSNQKLPFAITAKMITENSTYKPTHTTPPTGYEAGDIDAPYIVLEDTISNAYYDPKTYTLSYEPNGGEVSIASKKIQYNDYYGNMPTPYRKGYTFTGWFTQTSGGKEIFDNTVYTIDDDSTIFAHWKKNNYLVTYDYQTNGGTSATQTSASISYNSSIDLSPTATKNGWIFVGWNTDPNAATKLSSLKISDKDLTLYAIYKKDLVATFIDKNNRSERKIKTTIYNNQTSNTITAPTIRSLSKWTPLGWSLNTYGTSSVHLSPNANYELNTDTTFYALYVQDITITYDTNGSSQTFESQIKDRFFNASGDYADPIFTTMIAPSLDHHAFVAWEELDDTGSSLTILPATADFSANHDMNLVANWDQHPVLEAYDRYFTLEDAINKKITKTRLLEKVIANDREDGILFNGTEVTVKNYKSSSFTKLTSDAEIIVTYQAIDNFGTIVEKSITVHIVDTNVAKSKIHSYSRFISPSFYKNNGIYIPEELGGLASTSVWKTNETYQRLLDHAMEQDTPVTTFYIPKEELPDLN